MAQYRRVVRSEYVDGNVVRRSQAAPQRIPEVGPRPVRTNPRKKQHRSGKTIGTLSFLVAALCICGLLLSYYITLQSDITNSVKNISKLESQLNELKLANDEEYNRISSSMDLEEIKRIAIQELGMQYAKEGQVIAYESNDGDYVKQYNDIPK